MVGVGETVGQVTASHGLHETGAVVQQDLCPKHPASALVAAIKVEKTETKETKLRIIMMHPKIVVVVK